jgi:hypothetical protein
VLRRRARLRWLAWTLPAGLRRRPAVRDALREELAQPPKHEPGTGSGRTLAIVGAVGAVGVITLVLAASDHQPRLTSPAPLQPTGRVVAHPSDYGTSCGGIPASSFTMLAVVIVVLFRVLRKKL